MSGSSAKQIKRFLFRFILIALIIFICDLGIGNILKFFYFRQTSGLLYRTTYAIDSTRADILVFGSSRANHHYVPEVFEDSLGGTFYNTGRDGNFILYNYAIFKAITQRYQPKLIIFDVNPGELEFNAKSYELLSSLLPYSQDHHEIKHIVALRSPFEKVKLLSMIYPYNSILLTIAVGNLDFNKKRKSDNKGYIAINKTMKNRKIDAEGNDINEDAHVDEVKTAALIDIHKTCSQNKIKLFLVQSPVYALTGKNYCNPVISNFCAENNINYFDLSNQTDFINHPDYFADRIHLNNTGARLFSSLVINKIKVDDAVSLSDKD